MVFLFHMERWLFIAVLASGVRVSPTTGLSQLFSLHLRIVLDVAVGYLVEAVLVELLFDEVV